MQISGTGITLFTAKIKPDFKPETIYALNWQHLSSGNWVATDRTSVEDKYNTSIRLYNTESIILNFVTEIEANRTAKNNLITLTNFTSGEHIFGADLNYSGSIYATIEFDRRSQKTLRGSEQTLKLYCTSPSFVGGSGSLPLLQLLNIGYDGDSDRTINKIETYNRTFSYQEHSSDYGTFIGTFAFTDQEMISLKRYIATQRGNTISIPEIYGVSFPFGWRSSSYPVNVKILKFEDLGVLSIENGSPRWLATITFGEEI
jgi:hypothetical protein